MKLNFTEKVKCTALFITIVLCSFGSFAQSSITPSGNVSVGQTVTYNVQDDVIYSDYYWTADLGNVLSSWRSGITYYAQVEWTSAGASSLNFYANGGLLVYATITVVCPGAPATPTPTFSADANSCAPRLISYTGTPPGGVTWYWQTSTDGMDMSYAGNTYSVYNSQGLYVRARNNYSGCWSSGSAFYSATVSSTPSYPSNPTVSTNTCGAKTLTRGTPPAGVTWYWQGTTNMGTSTANSASTFTATTTGYYYLRARNNSTGCWSAAQGGIGVTINDPPQPPTPSTTSYSCGPQTLTVAGSPPANTTWYWQGTNANGTSTANPYTTNYSANTSGNNNYYLRAYNTLQGCWSQVSSSVNATVSSMPQTPYATLTVSTNLCGSKTVTISGTPPFNEVWHWQGLNASGTSINSNTTQVVTSTGTYYLRSLYMPSGCWSTNSQSVTVTVNDPPADPSVPTTTNNSCGSQTLSFNGTPPAGVTWYWQGTNANGTSTSNSASTYSASVSGANTYYLRAYSGTCWSTNSTSVSATVASIAQTPYATITISNNTCGPKTITISGTPPFNEVWHWQGTNPAGTTINSSTTVGAPTSGTYYLRSLYMPSGCWSTLSQAVAITVNDPLTPTIPTTTTLACGPQTLSKNGSAPANVSWYWQGTNSAGIDFTSPQATGVTYSAPLSGTYFLRARNTLGCWSPASASVVVSVNVIPSAPSMPTVSTNTCDAKTLTRVNPADGSIWYWQGNVSNGTSQANSATSFLATITGTNLYYLRALKSGCWSAQTQVNVTVTPTPVPPPVPVADINTCESKTLTKPTAPPGVSFFWQGVNAGTTDYTSSTAIAPTFEADASTTYYLRAKANAAACWSASTPITIAVNPVNISVSSYDQTNPNVQATSTIKLLPGVVVTAGKPFSAKIVISAECNNLVNWNEQTVYNETGTPISISRTYSDGFGNPLESQTKDFLSNKVFGSQSIFNSQGVPVASSLAAPLLETDFIYKKNLATNASGATYGPNDFDARTITGAQGEINNPKPFGTQPGTVGWYYSSSNTLEPLTPTTQFPYSRTYVPEGPDPTVSTSAGPGDQHRMGSGHEVKSERQLITPGELNHYYSLRSHFVSTPASWGTNLLSHISTNTTSGFTAYQNVTLSSAGGYLNVTCNQATSTPGIWPIGGTLNVTANKRYVFSAKGYKSSDASPVYLYVRTGTSGANIVWLGALIPTGAANEKWVSSPFLVPAGVTQITVGMLWATAAVGSTFNINGLELRPEAPDLVGYKHISTDPNGKLAVSFSDADGRGLASATIPALGSPPDNWSYTYYNDAGQVVASVAPKGVNTASSALPTFVTYFKYDHLGRMIETTSPDEGTSRFVYTLDGRIRFSENQVQRTATPKRFSYTNYDNLGRLIESGEYSSTAGGYVFEPHTTTTPAGLSVLNIIENNFSVPIDQVTSGNYTGVSKKLDAARCADYSYITYDQPGTGSPATQSYLIGQVSKTENENATTWYSYDEFGQLTWMKQNIIGLGVKSVDYTYDYFGNVTQVAYQAGQPDKFYHHYEYDLNQRLTHAYTSPDGTNKTLHAKYLYYLHGPLKRVELATNLQGIDYVYTINGALKSINHSDLARDPGSDGSNGFSTDVFGQVFDYYDNDYAGAGYSAGSVTATGLTNQYNGLIKDITWVTPVDNMGARKAYGYTYDNLYQLQNAQFGMVTGLSGNYTANLSATNYNESIPGYDKNGNILNLNRKSKTGTALGTYGYNYTANTNKVATITNSGSAMMGYTYNTIGQMTRQTEVGGQTLNVTYNAYGLTKEVRNASNQLLVSYGYDDRGDRVKKLAYNAGTLVKTTYYVHDAAGNELAIYEQPNPGTLALAEVPIYGAGRLGMYKPASTATFYEINDHLGNVRAVLGPARTETFTATMETEVAAAEDLKFKNIAPRVGWVNATVTPPAPAGNEAVRLSNARIAGPAIILKVAPGDVISAEVYAYYEGCTDCANTLPLASIVNAVAGAFGGVSGGVGEAGKIYTGINGALGSGFGGAAGSGNNAVPAAYLNLITFNNNLDVPNPLELPMAFDGVTSAANWAKEKLTIAPITITAPGYVYIYINNNSNSASVVHFDDLKVTHVHSPFVSGADFYPFGLTMSDREILTEPYRYGYQGQYAEEDPTTGWNEFELRMYDAKFGKWLSPDPYGQFASPYVGMGNNPISMTDKNGGWSSALTGALIGAGVGTAVGLIFDKENWYFYAAGGAGLGALGGKAYDASRYNLTGVGWTKKKAPGKLNKSRTPVIGSNTPLSTLNFAPERPILPLIGNLNDILRRDDFFLEEDDIVRIIVNRFQETGNSTTSRFLMRDPNGNTLTGYFLEPAGPSSTIRGSDRRIQAGVYDVGAWNSVDHPNTFEIRNVPGRTAILIHPGNYPLDTEGCFLPGGAYGVDNVSESVNKMNQIRNFLGNNPGRRVIMHLRDIHIP